MLESKWKACTVIDNKIVTRLLHVNTITRSGAFRSYFFRTRKFLYI